MIDVVGAVAIQAIEPESVEQPEPAHQAAGVAGVAAHYGDPMREQRALATRVGLVDRSHRGVLVVSGPERASWLHSLTTQHLTGLSNGHGTELLVLSPQGHIEQHALVAGTGDRIWLDTEPGKAGELLAFLTKMRFMTQVEPVDATQDYAMLSLVGPDVEAGLAAAEKAGLTGVTGLADPLLAPVPPAKFPSGAVPARATSRYEVRALPAVRSLPAVPGDAGWVRRGRLGVDLLVPRSIMADVTERMVAAGIPLCGLWAYEAIRVAARLPRLGFETDHRTIPAEVDWLAPAVHLDKGCYRGQETVARVHNLGRPPRRLVLLHLDGIGTDHPPLRHTPVTTEDGRVVGFVGTAVRHYELGMIALAVLKRGVPGNARLLVGESAAAIDPEPSLA